MDLFYDYLYRQTNHYVACLFFHQLAIANFWQGASVYNRLGHM